MLDSLGGNVLLRRRWQRKSPQGMFDSDLPSTYRTQIDLVLHLSKHLPSSIGKSWNISNKPEEGARIQQNPHVFSPANAASRSSGRGSKNSGGTVNSPLASPIGRFTLRAWGRGRISAIGTFRLHKRIVSPFSNK